MDDFESIRQLTARYNRCFDDRDIDGWLACWTPDGEFEFLDSGRRILGHDALRANIETVQNTGRHVTTDFIITVDGDRATQSCQLCELGIDDTPVVRRFGRYEDHLTREAGAWHFRTRRLRYG